MTGVLRSIVAAGGLCLASHAAAQIDMTGTWSVSLDLGVTLEATFSQTGTALSSSDLGSGTIDPLTGVFHVEAPATCDVILPPPLPPVHVEGTNSFDGTVAPDGLTFSGSSSVLVVGTPSHPCVNLDGPMQGTRVGEQTILGKSLTVKDPKPGIDFSKRKIVGLAKEKSSSNTLVGDPTLGGGAGGAVLEVFVNGTTPSAQEFALPQGTSPAGQSFWSGSGGKGFKYRDPRGDQGPVEAASIKRSGNGSFTIKAVIDGKHGTVDVAPPNLGSDGCMALDIGIDPAEPGDRYSVRFGPESTIKNVGNTLFKASKPMLGGVSSGGDHHDDVVADQHDHDHHRVQLPQQRVPDSADRPAPLTDARVAPLRAI